MAMLTIFTYNFPIIHSNKGTAFLRVVRRAYPPFFLVHCVFFEKLVSVHENIFLAVFTNHVVRVGVCVKMFEIYE